MTAFFRSIHRILGTVALVVLAGSAPGMAQDRAWVKADSLLRAGSWSAAAEAYEALARGNPSNGEAWFRLGSALSGAERYRDAIDAFQRGLELDFSPATSAHRIALAHAANGAIARALDWLQRAVEAGYNRPEALRGDDRLAALRPHPRFPEIVAAAERNARPCEHEEVYRQFDFWVGDWDVLNPSGERVGTNRIERTLDGCMLLENWTGVGGGQGKSINYYDPEAGRWIQIWVDSFGGTIRAQGELVDGAMRFQGRHVYGNGRAEAFRMTFTPQPDGSVRQFIEQSANRGNWYVWFDGLYVRRN